MKANKDKKSTDYKRTEIRGEKKPPFDKYIQNA